MKKIRIITAAIALMTLGASGVRAAGLAIDKDVSSAKYSVTGDVGGALYRSGAIVVVKDGEDIIFSDNTEIVGGTISFDFYMPYAASTKEYTLYVGTYDQTDNTPGEKSFSHQSTKLQDECIADLKNKNALTAAGYIKDNKELLELSNSAAHPVSDTVMDKVYANVFAMMPEGGFEAREDFYAAYDKAVAIAALCAAPKDKMAAIFEEYSDVVAVSLAKCFPLIAENSISYDDIYERLASAEFATESELYTQLCNIIMLESVKNAKTYGVVMNNFRDYGEFTSIDFDYYNRSNKANQAIKLVGKDYKTVKLLEDAFKSNYKPKPNNDGGGGGSDGAIYSPTPVGNAGKPSTNASFNDMEDAVWAQSAVAYLAERGIINGFDDGGFHPNENITRGQFAVLVVAAFGLENDAAQSDFIDVPKNHWAYTAISSAVERGIVQGIGDGCYGVNDMLTRQDMAVICSRALAAVGVEIPKADATGFVDDADIADYAKSGVSFMKNNAIVSGYEDGSFRPLGNATRAEAAKIIYSILTGGIL